jgi:hypothetical protein
MTDAELIARLREDVFYGDERLHNLSRHNPLHMEAADRIEALTAKLATCEKYRDAYAECDRIGAQAVRDLEAKLAKAVEAAFYEGFFEGRDGGWVWGDPTPAWKKSDALAELKGQNDA